MIIRSQNKEILERFDGFKLLPKDRVKVEQEKESNNNGKDIERCCAYIDDINGRNAIVGTTDRRYEELGIYSTKEKALKVLDMMEEQINDMEQFKARGELGNGWILEKYVFQMPQEEDL